MIGIQRGYLPLSTKIGSWVVSGEKKKSFTVSKLILNPHWAKIYEKISNLRILVKFSICANCGFFFVTGLEITLICAIMD